MIEFSLRLSQIEVEIADRVGMFRHETGQKYIGRDGQPRGLSLDHHTIGARGELAIAKMMGWYWDFSAKGFGKPDFTPNVDVKTTIYKTGKLVIGTHGRAEFVYVLVYYNCETYTAKALGFIRGVDAMKESNLKKLRDDRPPVYVIEQSTLQPMFTWAF